MTTATATNQPTVSNKTNNYAFNWKLDRKIYGKSIFSKIKTTEIVDIDMLESFIQNNMGINYGGIKRYEHLGVSNENIQMIKYKQLYNPDSKRFYTSYSLNKHKWGRINASHSLSLSVFHRPTRHAFCLNKYIDVDMENAQPTIINEICKQHGICSLFLNEYVKDKKTLRKLIAEHHGCEKDVAKNLPIVMMMGGTYDGWIKENNIYKNEKNKIYEVVEIEKELRNVMEIVYANNSHIKDDVLKQDKSKWINELEAKRGVMGLWSQSIERLVQETVIEMVTTKYNIPIEEVVPSQDGFMILKNYWDTNIINDIHKCVYEKLKLNVSFVVKEFDEAIIIPALDTEKADKLKDDLWKYAGVTSDTDSAKKVLKLYPYWVYCNGELFVFDKKTGMWSDDKETHKSIITEHTEYLYTMNNNEKSKTISYGNTTSLKLKCLSEIPQFVINNNWLVQNQSSSLNYLLFNNGYINMKTVQFFKKDVTHETNGYNPKIVFFGKIHQDYSLEDGDSLEYMDDIKQRLFYNSLGKETGDFLILQLARGLAGDVMKKMIFGLGAGDSGKGIQTSAIKYSLGDYYGDFNGEDLAYTTSSQDSGQKQRWMMLLRFKRIIISNEINMKIILNGNIIKRIASGGDSLVARGHGGNETSFETHFLPILLANDLPKIKPYDDAVDNRIKVCSFLKTYVDEPKNEFELKKDDGIKEEIKTLKFQRHFVKMLLFAYCQYIDNGKVDIEPLSVSSAKKDWIENDRSSIDTFINDYEITNNKDDYVKSSDIEEWIKEKELGISMKKFGTELKLYASIKKLENICNGAKKIKGKSLVVWYGVKMIMETNE